MGGDLNALGIAHHFLSLQVRPGDRCIDATAGRGRDTAFLCGLVGPSGHVTAFDIQQDALDSTREHLESLEYRNYQLVLDSHANMGSYAEPGSLRAITFNFGWLPGGDHTVFTQPDSSIAAIEAGLTLLMPGGIMSLCIYAGRETGFGERDALLRYLPTLDSKRYSVLLTDFCNRPNNPPRAAFIIRD